MAYDTSIVFICMGNICRSPTAEGVFRHKVRAAGLKVIPQCPFVKAYIEKHAEYRDLLK